MASGTETMVAPPGVDTEWDEPNLIFSLARLQEMHIQLRNLRESIAHIVDPTLGQHSSPEDFYTSFSRSAKKTADEIKRFTMLVADTQSNEILEKSKACRAIDLEPIKDWIVNEHEDWLNRKVEEAKENALMDEEAEDAHKDTLETKWEDIRAVIDTYKENHSGIEISLVEHSKIEVCLPPPAHINFEIEPKLASETQAIYNVTCKGNSQFHAAIIRAVAARPQANDLKYLFETLASYADIKTRPCLKCRRLLDQNAQFPVVRTRKRTKESDGHFATHWQAYHVGCT